MLDARIKQLNLPINGIFEYVEDKSLLISIWIACKNFRTLGPIFLSRLNGQMKWVTVCSACQLANENYGYGYERTFNTTIPILDSPIYRIPWIYLCIFCISKTLNCEHQQASWKYSSKNEFHFYLIATVCLTLTKLK